jgi:hypothetical protein
MAVSIASCTITRIQSPNYFRMKDVSVTIHNVNPPTQQTEMDLNVPSGVQPVMVSIASHPHSNSPLSSKSATGFTLKIWERIPFALLLGSTASMPAKCFMSQAKHALRSFWNRIWLWMVGCLGGVMRWDELIVLNVSKSCLFLKVLFFGDRNIPWPCGRLCSNWASTGRMQEK